MKNWKRLCLAVFTLVTNRRCLRHSTPAAVMMMSAASSTRLLSCTARLLQMRRGHVTWLRRLWRVGEQRCMVIECVACQALQVTRRMSHVTRHTSHITHHTSHVTHHTPHVTRHTSHVTHHTPHATHHLQHGRCKRHLLKVRRFSIIFDHHTRRTQALITPCRAMRLSLCCKSLAGTFNCSRCT